MISTPSGINLYSDKMFQLDNDIFKSHEYNPHGMLLNKESFTSKMFTDSNTYPVETQLKGCGSPFSENQRIDNIVYDFHFNSEMVKHDVDISYDFCKVKENMTENNFKGASSISESNNVHNLDFLSENENSSPKAKLHKLCKSNDSNLVQSVNQTTKIGRRDIWYKKILRGMRKYYKHQMLSIDQSIGKIKWLKQKYDVIKNCAREIWNSDTNKEYYLRCNMPFYLAAISYPNETKKMLKDLIKKNPQSDRKLKKAEEAVLIIIDLLYHFFSTKASEIVKYISTIPFIKAIFGCRSQWNECWRRRISVVHWHY